MAVYRVKHDQKNPYVMINKDSLWDTSISLPAIAVWARCLSRPNDWEFNTEELAKACGVNKETMKKYLKELEDHGYIKRSQSREGGQFSRMEYDFLEHPSLAQEDNEELNKCLPQSGKPSTVFPPLLSIKEELKIEKKLPLPPRETYEHYKTQKGEEVFSKETLKKKMPRVTQEEFDFAWGEYQQVPPGSVKAVRQWLMAVVERYRYDNQHIKIRKNRICAHKWQADLEETMNPSFVTACRDHVEFSRGVYCKTVAYDMSDEEWFEKTGFKDIHRGQRQPPDAGLKLQRSVQ